MKIDEKIDVNQGREECGPGSFVFFYGSLIKNMRWSMKKKCESRLCTLQTKFNSVTNKCGCWPHYRVLSPCSTTKKKQIL